MQSLLIIEISISKEKRKKFINFEKGCHFSKYLEIIKLANYGKYSYVCRLKYNGYENNIFCVGLPLKKLNLRNKKYVILPVLCCIKITDNFFF